MPPRSPSRPFAVGLVFGSSAAVLVVELVALRLVAPYWGLTLETNTIVIGLALLAIAAGAWLGGQVADRRPPAPLLAPLLTVSGVVVAGTPFAVRGAGATGDPTLLLLAVVVTIVAPGALLSAVTPVVTKLQLTDLEETGAVVGRLSGISTLGGIAGTILTGFVLVTAVPVTGILVSLGVVLALTGVAVAVLVGGRAGATRATGVPVVAGAVLAAGLSVVGPGGCDLETEYHCVELRADPDRPGARLLVMDGVRHSYVDPADPGYLDFAYIRTFAAAVDAVADAGEPLRVHHLGGAGLTMPRLLAAERPGTRSTVSEIDPGLVRTDGSILDGSAVPGLEVRVEDGRRGLARLEAGSVDLVVGDAFGGVSVPWHLTTREALLDIRRALDADGAAGGAYVLNVIDRGPLAFARAQVATARTVFDEVAVVLPTEGGADFEGGNVVVVAGAQPLDVARMRAALGARGQTAQILTGGEVHRWVADADVLTDDHAPVDQLLTPYGT